MCSSYELVISLFMIIALLRVVTNVLVYFLG